jgi:hypothetical protein
MITDLGELRKNAEMILLAELAAFLHNLGKCNENFIQAHSEGQDASQHPYRYPLIAGTMRRWVEKMKIDDKTRFQVDYDKTENPENKNLLDPQLKEEFFWKTQVELPNAIHDLYDDHGKAAGYSAGFFLDFQDYKWFNFEKSPVRIATIFNKVDRALRLAHICHAMCSASEQVGKDFEENQPFQTTFRATAFGYDLHRIEVEAKPLSAALKKISTALLAALSAKQSDEKKNPGALGLSNPVLRQTLETEFSKALAETQRPRNDVTLWDFSHTTGSLFKAAIAWSILNPELPVWKDLATEPEWKNLKLDLQFLTISWNYFQFMQSAARLIDVLSRQHFLNKAIARTRDYWEAEVPLANLVYQDEDRLIFLAPGGGEELLNCQDNGKDLRSILKEMFFDVRNKSCVEKYAEIVPNLKLFPIKLDPTPIKTDKPDSNDLGFGAAIKARTQQHSSDAAGFTQLWSQINPDQAGYDVCPVCGLRPVGYDDAPNFSEKADRRGVCRVCEERRLDRAQKWLDPQNYARTIWIDEVADDNGRVALIAGRFHLDEWFDPESKFAESISKVISFARARRIWETTRNFWVEVVADDMMAKVSGMAKRRRLKLFPFKDSQLTNSLSPYHSYEAQLYDPAKSKILARFAALWDGECFHVTENSGRLKEKLGEGAIQEKFSQDKVLRVFPEDSRLQERDPQVVQAKIQQPEEIADAYCPLIDILTQPALAMFLVPAQAALAYAEKIKEKYDREMGKVKDRLPLNLGIVYFPKEIPISAVLDAGRRLVRHRQGPEIWKIEEVKQRTGLDQELNRCEFYYDFIFSAPKRDKRNKVALITMRFAIARGDGQPDSAHTKFLKYEGDPSQPIDKTKFTICPIAELKPGDWVRMAISHFDFVFLDQAGKRFELALPPDEISRYHETLNAPRGPRPYLLENLPQFSEIRDLLQKLPPGQHASDLHAIRDLLLQKYRAWKLGFGDSAEPAFRSLAEQVVRKEFGLNLNSDEAKKLLAAITNGVFFDALELYMHIMKSF